MKKLLFLIFLISCNPVKRLERNVKQIESLKQILGICICLELAKPSFEPGYPQFFPHWEYVGDTLDVKGWYNSFDSVDVYADTLRLKQYNIGWVDSIGIGECCTTQYDTLDIH